MDKKGQALSLNTIIVAIVVLIVLVVLIMVFTGYFGTRFTPEVTSCANAGGSCQFECGTDSFGNDVAKLSAQCPGEQVCCSKGLGSGGVARVQDGPNCGKEGNAPCSVGVECAAGGLVNGLCQADCSASCVSACTDESMGNTDTTKETKSINEYCKEGICCEVVAKASP